MGAKKLKRKIERANAKEVLRLQRRVWNHLLPPQSIPKLRKGKGK